MNIVQKCCIKVDLGQKKDSMNTFSANKRAELHVSLLSTILLYSPYVLGQNPPEGQAFGRVNKLVPGIFISEFLASALQCTSSVAVVMAQAQGCLPPRKRHKLSSGLLVLPIPVSTIVHIWGVNQGVRDFSAYDCLSKKKKKRVSKHYRRQFK